MDISDIKKDTKHVYVINNTKTDLSITVRDDDGVSRLLRVLRASIPQDVSEVISPLVLKRTASFKRALTQGYITLIAEKQAEKILKTKEAQLELAAIKKKLARIPKELMVDSEETATPLESLSGGASDPGIRAEVKDIAVDLEEPAEDKFARLLAVHSEEPLTSDEVTWLLTRLPTGVGQYGEIVDWLQDKS